MYEQDDIANIDVNEYDEGHEVMVWFTDGAVYCSCGERVAKGL